jgi:AraC family transcriptional regulator
MLTYSSAANVARRVAFGEPESPDLRDPLRQRVMPPPSLGRFDNRARPENGRALCEAKTGEAEIEALEIFPADVVSRRAVEWEGIGVDLVQAITHDAFECRYRSPRHLLLVYEEGVRDSGETRVENLPASSLRTLQRKLTFVPAGHEFFEWQRPRIRSRVICLYFDPAKLPVRVDASCRAPIVAPRLFFEHNVVWETAVKLGKAMEDASEDQRYWEALGIIIAHELLSVQVSVAGRGAARGGLAVWQQRIATAYIDEHLAESIPLAELAKLVDLSSHYFCRAFRQSFGVPPHRYHINRRIERAKMLLADRAMSVTDIGLALGFSETSSFSATFRSTTGTSPTEYRRALDEGAGVAGMPESQRSPTKPVQRRA